MNDFKCETINYTIIRAKSIENLGKIQEIAYHGYTELKNLGVTESCVCIWRLSDQVIKTD